MIKIKEKVPIIDESKCSNCDTCFSVCPRNAIIKNVDYTCSKCIKYCITMEVPCNPEHKIFCYENCDTCGLCVTSCPENAISWFEIPVKHEKSF
jgi:Pyruvate/2-oxoacid:ferredoxin oxidoreductase delta subunit